MSTSLADLARRDPLAGDAAAWATALAEIQSLVDQASADLDPFQFNWKPSPESWSVGECLDHLNRVDRLLLPRLEAAAARTEPAAAGVPATRMGAVARWFVRAVSPASQRALKAPALYRPTTSRLEPADVRVEFAELQLRLRALLGRLAGRDLARPRVASPALALLRLPLGAWLASIAAHQTRHLAQIVRVVASPGFPRGASGAPEGDRREQPDQRRERHE